MDKKKYMREYILKRYHSRRKQVIKKLGSKCSVCNSKENLEIDHISQKDKSFSVSRLWSINKTDFWKEIEKCQILCKNCHKKKTLQDLGQKDARENHGTLSSYRYCKCDLCRQAKSEYNKKYRSRSLKVKRPSFKRNSEGSSPSGTT